METFKRRRTYTGLNGVISKKAVLMLLMVHELLCNAKFLPWVL